MAMLIMVGRIRRDITKIPPQITTAPDSSKAAARPPERLREYNAAATLLLTFPPDICITPEKSMKINKILGGKI